MKNRISRRRFLANTLAGGCAFCFLSRISTLKNLSYAGLFSDDKKKEIKLKECMFYDKKPEMKVECQICPRKCSVADAERGYCGVRENLKGTYYTLVHSYPCSIHTDPIEKKPLFHFLPGTLAYSLATAGCNIECKFCQNWEIAQFRPEQVESIYLPPPEVHKNAKSEGALTIAGTYSEPTIFYEYLYDIAKLSHKTGIRTVMISNGFIQEKPLREITKYLAAIKIDFKGFTEKFYKEICSGELKPVLETLVRLKKIGIWSEIVVLVIRTLNDSEKELKNMTKWIVANLGKDVPVHFTRFHPTYKIKNLPPTPVATLEMAREIALVAGINYAYLGNVPGHPGENTYCPKCKGTVIGRVGFYIRENNLKAGKCSKCGNKIPGVWS